MNGDFNDTDSSASSAYKAESQCQALMLVGYLTFYCLLMYYSIDVLTCSNDISKNEYALEHRFRSDRWRDDLFLTN